jgi:hypothetical protein
LQRRTTNEKEKERNGKRLIRVPPKLPIIVGPAIYGFLQALERCGGMLAVVDGRFVFCFLDE